MSESLLVVNAGSSSLKFSVFEFLESGDIRLDISGSISGNLDNLSLKIQNNKGEIFDSPEIRESLKSIDISDYSNALIEILQTLKPNIRVKAIGHRIVHGGQEFTAPVLLDAKILSRLHNLVSLAPLHLPLNLAPIKSLQLALPHVPQIACFDTSFHGTQSELAKIVALPKIYRDEGVVNYGFHGLSYEYISEELKKITGSKLGKVIVAHLGSGSSLCAMIDGVSFATTMGFSPLNGLVMGTRPGNLDPGAILYLIRHHALGIEELEKILYKESGLLAISGISSDMQTLISSLKTEAKLAVDYFIYRVTREIGSLIAAIKGIDRIVFTGGIGENSDIVRERVCKELAWLGVEIDLNKNCAKEQLISTTSSRVAVHVIPTNENLMIARHVVDCIS